MKIAVYAGTFDPLTLGHLSVIERAVQLFDELHVLIAENPEKRPLFTLEQRLDFLRDATRELGSVKVASTAGLVVEYARAMGARFLVRGVRGATDAEYEAWLAAADKGLAPEVQTLFLPADPELSRVSSSRLKQLSREGADVSAWATPRVAQALCFAFSTKEEQHV
ncbi:MAG: pantetheine-phosphate adenylyltransferase [Polyangiaceae bacterium]